jgi:hypothetical protein
MADSTCAVHGCGKPVLARGWCGTHYRRWRIHGDPGGAELIRKPAGSVACSVEGCAGKARVNGLCGKHYQRWERLGSTELLKRAARTCSAEDCTEAAESRGWCSKHYKRWQAHGDPEATLFTETCSVEGCGRGHSGRGLCVSHYARWKAGAPLNVPFQAHNKGAVCPVADCGKPAEKRGWCSMHYARWRKHGDVDAAMLDRTPSPDGMCVVCRTEPVAADSVRYCSARCTARAARARLPKPPTEVLICVDCKDLFERPSRIGFEPQLCRSCRETRERVNDRKAAHVRRARMWSREIEDFDDIEIFVRDNWICGLCGDPVDGSLRAPVAGSPSLDHVLPISRGGSHTARNCQLAHLGCNIRKNNRVMT